MNLEDKHIDELFREAANQSQAPLYESDYWNEMEALLNHDENRRKGLVLWSSFGSVLLVGLFSSLFLFNDTSITYFKQALNLNVEAYNQEQINRSTENLEKLFLEDNIRSAIPSLNLSSNQDDGLSSLIEKDQNTSNTFDAKLNKTPGSVLTLSLPIEQLSLRASTRISEIKHIQLEETKQLLNHKQLSAYSPYRTSIELGAGASQVYNNTTNNPYLISAGVKTDYTLNNFVISTGLGISIEKNPGITVSERAKVYGFGVTNFENNLNYKTLVDLVVPIQIAFEVRKNSFGIGAQMRYLAHSSMRYESKENGETMMADNLSGLTTGLNPFNVDAYGFYERSITKNLQLGARITQQLSSRITSSKYFNNLDRTKVFNAQIYLKHTLFNH